MSKVHITLVGGQPAPVYHGIVATRPDKVVYIYSNSSESRKALQALEKEISIDSDRIELDVTQPHEILACAEKLAEQYKNDVVTVNISSGLKSWSHWFGVVFDKVSNASVVYMDQNNVLWDYRTMESVTDFEFDMHTLFRLYGNSLENNFTPYTNYTDEDFTVLTEVENMRNLNIGVFNKLTTILSRERANLVKHAKSYEFRDGESFVKWNKKENTVILGIKKKTRVVVKTLVSPNVMSIVFNAGWFELKIAKLLSRWSHAKEICLNCRFPFKKDVDKNEVDILINTGVKILFVECKTQITTTTDIDKFRSVIKEYGGIGSKGLFITDAIMTDIAKEKCNDRKILSFSLQDSHLGMETEKALFWLLDSELYNINAK